MATPEHDAASPATSTVRVSLPTRFPQSQVAELLLRPDAVSHWLGKNAHLTTEPDECALLPRAIDIGAEGYPQISYTKWPEPWFVLDPAGRPGVFEVRMCPVAGDDHDDERLLIFRVTARPDGTSVVRICERGLPDRATATLRLQMWQSALNRLADLLTEATRVQSRLRQAVIIVHGIGEQQPGETLRAFSDALFPRPDADSDAQDSTARRRFSKPDYFSSLFDMRLTRIDGDINAQIPGTDVYELYWAHLIRDTTVDQVYGWMTRLVLAGRDRIPPALRSLVWAVRAVLALGAAVVVALMVTGVLKSWEAATTTGVLAVIAALTTASWGLLKRVVILGIVGDAARYLEARPGNIAGRQAIRQAGVALLDAMHDSGRYERIIVFGHSLGSVIAYDILSYAWIRRGRRRTGTTVMTSRALTTLEDSLNPRTDRPVPDIDIRALQHAAWREYRRNGFDWLVSDFVTAGSPLASADWLLGRAEGSSFADLKRDKILPTCPPQTEPARTPRPDTMREQFTFTHAYPDERNPNRSRSVQVPNHAALFALTRWTNLYFPKEWFIKGDPVGGQLNSVFGSWIKDVKLSNPGGGLLGFAHTFYWSRRGSGAHIERLREALELRYPVKLDDLVLPVPAVVLSELGT